MIQLRWNTGHWFIMLWILEIFMIFANFLRSSVAQQLVNQLLYTMFITNNYDSFHLCWKQSLVKYQKFSKYYVHDCLHFFCLLFTFIKTTIIVKKQFYFGCNWLYLSKKLSAPNLKDLRYWMWTSVKRLVKQLSE